MPYRSAKDQKHYDTHKKGLPTDSHCEFCSISRGDHQFISETTHFKIIRNIFPYSYWDHQRVADHLMIVPKQHTNTLSDLPEIAASEYVKLISSYEKSGYNVYARAPQSKQKSIMHQHTHLIKPEASKVIKTVFYRAKPYIRILH
jgi:diadenosine tetraphosphate (Ap4A) HIT family hydrolase